MTSSLTHLTPRYLLSAISNFASPSHSSFTHHRRRCRICISTAMAPLRLGSLLAGVVACLPVLAAASNSSYSEIDMLRTQLELMEGRSAAAGCPPW